MATTKQFTTTTATGQTVYCIVRRDSDGALLRASDGAFENSLTATQAAQILTENTTLKGLYEGTENRTAWNDGSYTFICYAEFLIGTVAPVNDLVTGVTRVNFRNDIELNLTEIYTLTASVATIVSGSGLAGIIKGSITDLSKQITALYSLVRDLQQRIAKSGGNNGKMV